jgi:DNA topoisomerase IA
MIQIPENKKVTVFIEASGKIDRIRNLFSEIGIYNIHIEATKGRLFDLPKDRLGLRKDNFNLLEREPINQYRLNYIKEAADADFVFIMTDDDIEGEVIANDLFNLITTDKVFRLRLHSLNIESLKYSLENSTEITKSTVIGGLARRAYDRYVGYSNYSHDYKNESVSYGYIGRVITPTLSALKIDDSPMAYVNKRIEISKDEFWNITFPVMADELSKVNGLVESVASLTNPTIELVNKEVTPDNSRPMTGGEAMLSYAEATGHSVIDVSDAMQELYEEGRLSYPRTDSFYLSDETVRQMRAMAEEFGVKGFDEEFFKNKAQAINKLSNSQDAHEGIHPLTFDYPITSPISAMALKDQIMILTIRNILRSGQKERVIKKETGKIILNSETSKSWSIALSNFKSKPIIERKTTFVVGKKNQNEINDYMSPMGIPNIKKKVMNTTLRLIKKDEKVLSAMINNNLGRPSTYSYYSKKISSRFLKKDGELNRLADLSLFHASRLAPGLLDIKKANEIENELHNGNGSIHERVIKALYLTGGKGIIAETNEFSPIISSDKLFEEVLPDF